MTRTKQAAVRPRWGGGKATSATETRPTGGMSRRATGYAATDDDYNDDDLPESYDNSQDSVDEVEGARIAALNALQAAMSRVEKNDNFAKTFELKVRTEEKRLLDMLDEEQAKMQSEEEQFQAQFETLLKSALAPLSGPAKDVAHIDEGEEDPEAQGATSFASHPLYVASKTMLERSHAVLDSYERVNDYIRDIDQLPNLAEEWEKDYVEARRLIIAGREASALEIEKMITYDKARVNGVNRLGGKALKRKRDSEMDENLKAMFEIGKADDEEEEEEDGSEMGKGREEIHGWGITAHRLRKGLRALISAFPESGKKS
ncbi:hypothetical protein DIZ76_015504 [Coccidioides immitis]|nr:hypothetical protein DIZ76_015504 [Coccidioides immitis]